MFFVLKRKNLDKPGTEPSDACGGGDGGLLLLLTSACPGDSLPWEVGCSLLQDIPFQASQWEDSLAGSQDNLADHLGNLADLQGKAGKKDNQVETVQSLADSGEESLGKEEEVEESGTKVNGQSESMKTS